MIFYNQIRVKQSEFEKDGDDLKLSTKGRYGLRALIDLALYSESEAVSIQSIATRQNISDSYLEQLVRKLKSAGLVVSVRGAQGGYKLARPAGEISVGAVSYTHLDVYKRQPSSCHFRPAVFLWCRSERRRREVPVSL